MESFGEGFVGKKKLNSKQVISKPIPNSLESRRTRQIESAARA